MILFGLLTTAASILLGGYYFGTDDQLDMLPILRAMTEPGTYASDWFVQASGGMNVRLFYLWLLHGVSIPIGLPAAAFVLYVASVTALFAGIATFARGFLRDGAAALLAAFIAVMSPLALELGHSRLVNHQMLPNLLAYALAAWAAVFAVRDRPVGAGLALGLATLMQGLVGVLACVLVAGVMIGAHGRRLRRRAGAWAAGAAALLLVAAPNVILVLSAELAGDPTGASPQDFAIYAQLRIPFHVLPSTWPASAWVAGKLMFAFLVRAGVGTRAIHAGSFWVTAAIVLLGFAVGTVFVDLVPSAMVARMQLFRGMTAFRVLFAVAMVHAIDRAGHDRWARALLFGAAAAACLHERVWLLSGGPLLLATVVPAGRPRRIAVVIAVAATVFALTDLMADSAREAKIIIAIASLVFAAAALGGFADGARLLHLRRMQWATAGGMAAAFAVLTPWRAGGLAPPRLTVAAWRLCNHSAPDDRPRNAAQRVGRWASEHLPRDAVVLVAPWFKDFRYRSGRAVVVDFKAVPFTWDGLRQWQRRFFDVCGVNPDALRPGEPPDLYAAFDVRSGSDLARTAGDYGARYLAIERDVDGPWRMIHRDGAQRLYELDSTGTETVAWR